MEMLQFAKSLRNYEQKQVIANKQRKSFMTPRKKTQQENLIDASNDNMLKSSTALTLNVNNSNNSIINSNNNNTNLKILSMQTGDEFKSKSLMPLKRTSLNLNSNEIFVDKISDKRLFDRQYRLFADSSSNNMNSQQHIQPSNNKHTTSTSSFIKLQSPVKAKASIVEVNYTVKNKYSSNLDLLVVPKDMKAVLTPNGNPTKSRNLNIVSMTNINNKSLKENQQVFNTQLTRSFYQKTKNKLEPLPSIEKNPKKSEMKRNTLTVNIKNGATSNSNNIQLGNLNINSVELAPASAKRKHTPNTLQQNQQAAVNRNRFVNSRYLYFSKSTSFESQTLDPGAAPTTPKNNISTINKNKTTTTGIKNSIETQSSSKSNSEQFQQKQHQHQKTVEVDMRKIFDIALDKSEEIDESTLIMNTGQFVETKMSIFVEKGCKQEQVVTAAIQEQVKHDDEVLNEEYDEQAELAYLNEVKRKVSDWLDKYVIPFWSKSKA